MSGEDGPGYRLSILGTWRLTSGGEEIPLQRGGQRVLVLLAVRGRLTRLQAAAALHPEVSEPSALTRLRSAVARIHRRAPGLLVTVEGNLDLAATMVDLHRVRAVARDLGRGRTSVSTADPSDLFRLIDCEELLPGWYDDWLLLERERLSEARVTALEAVAAQCLSRGDHALALEAATAAVSLDPLRESAQRALVEVHLARGNLAVAQRQADAYCALVRHELGIELPQGAFCGLLQGRGRR
jgi:DNA-binding SARP family transcriptional activator